MFTPRKQVRIGGQTFVPGRNFLSEPAAEVRAHPDLFEKPRNYPFDGLQARDGSEIRSTDPDGHTEALVPSGSGARLRRR